MTDDDEFQPAPSREVVLAGIRRLALGMDELSLDIQIALTQARRNVAAAHQLHDIVDVWQDQLLVLDEVRRERVALEAAMDEATSPVKTRELTADEMADWDAD